jgi:hypothetical protein
MALGALDGPYIAAIDVTPSNTTVFPLVTKGLYIGNTGTVVVHWPTANTTTFPSANGFTANTTFANVQAGTILNIRVDKVLTTTTATSIIALF